MLGRAGITHQLYAVISPMPIEAQYLRSHLQNKKNETISGIQYVLGTIDGREVISAVTGYGKVNVTTVASRLIANFHPKAIILAETAGAVNQHLNIGDVIIGSSVFDADFGKLTNKGPVLPILIPNPINHKKEPMIYYPASQLLHYAKILVRQKHFKFNVVTGKLADSDFLPNPEWQLKLLKENHVQAIAMDGAPIAKLCWIFNIPCLVIHSISNIAGNKIEDNGTTLAAKHVGMVTVELLKSF